MTTNKEVLESTGKLFCATLKSDLNRPALSN